MAHNALDAVVDKAVDYDRMRTPLAPGLQRAVAISSVSLVVSLIVLLLVPWLIGLTLDGFFLVGGQLIGRFLLFVMRIRPVLYGINAVCLLGFGVLLYFTDMLEAGRAIWHDVALVEVVVASIYALFVSLGLLLIVVNLVIGILIFLLIMAVLFGVLAGGRR